MFSKGIPVYYLTIYLFLQKAYSECPTRIPMPLTAYSAVPRSEMPSINQFFPYLSEQSNITSLVSHNNLIKFITAKEINTEVAETDSEQLTVTEVFDNNLSSVVTNDRIKEEKLTVEKVVLISNETLTKESENVRNLDVTPKVVSSHQIKKKMIPAVKTKPKYIQLQNDNPTIQTPKMIPIFKPKENIRKNNMHTALQTPVNNLNINSKIIKPDIPYQTLPINVKSQNVQPQLNQMKQMKLNANPNPVLKATKFDLPCQRASDILNEPLNDILKGNPTCRMKPVERKQFLNLKPKIKRPNLNSQCQMLPNINQRFQKSATATSRDALVLMKPKTTTITKDYGNFVKKITTAVLLPSCVVNLTA